MDIKPLITALGASLLLASTSFAQATRPEPPRPPRPFPVVETEPLSVGATCVQDGEEVPLLHFAKIRFVISRGQLVPRDGRDGGRLNLLPREIPLTIIVRHDPTRIHDVTARVLAFLRARSDGLFNRQRIEILSTDYSTECATPEEEENPPRPPLPPRH